MFVHHEFDASSAASRLCCPQTDNAHTTSHPPGCVVPLPLPHLCARLFSVICYSAYANHSGAARRPEAGTSHANHFPLPSMEAFVEFMWLTEGCDSERDRYHSHTRSPAWASCSPHSPDGYSSCLHRTSLWRRCTPTLDLPHPRFSLLL